MAEALAYYTEIQRRQNERAETDARHHAKHADAKASAAKKRGFDGPPKPPMY